MHEGSPTILRLRRHEGEVENAIIVAQRAKVEHEDSPTKMRGYEVLNMIINPRR